MQQLEREKDQLRGFLAALSSAALKSHMLAALDEFQAPAAVTDALEVPTAQAEDEVVTLLRQKAVRVQRSRDALFVAVHAMILEAGFESTPGTKESFALPSDWDANSANGLINVRYTHPSDAKMAFSLQGLFVGNKFEVYFSDDKNHSSSIELSADTHVKSTAGEDALAAEALQNLPELRARFKPFIEGLKPKKPKAETAAGVPDRGLPSFHPLGPDRAPPPFAIPSVGGGDLFPPSIGGGSSGMLVGPDHALFGRHRDPGIGPVPGARFDPYGPPSGPSGFGPMRPPFGGPSPSLPFGDPNPDHLRMPRDDDLNPGFGFGGGRRGGGGGDPFSQPFGSNHSFF